MITIIEGNVGAGKTYLLSKQMLLILKRNKKWIEKKKTATPRKVVTNMKVNTEIMEEYNDYLHSWEGLQDLVQLRESDIIFDDMSTYLDAQEWANIPMTVKHWLRLHEHYGCDIYGNAQDFNTIYKSVRQLTSKLSRVHKIIGSGRPAKTKPRIKRIWGYMLERNVDDKEFEQEKDDRKQVGWPTIHKIKQDVCNIFDTTQDLNPGEYPPLDHIERACHTCGNTKIIHK